MHPLRQQDKNGFEIVVSVLPAGDNMKAKVDFRVRKTDHLTLVFCKDTDFIFNFSALRISHFTTNHNYSALFISHN